jgi:hypothetical protein
MSDTDDTNSDLERLRELPIRSEEIGFAQEAMVACEKCGRSNAPNRDICMYCGAGLAGPGAEASHEIREPESWENGYNVVVLTSDTDNIEPAVRTIASLLATEIEALRAILASGKRLPIARVGSETQADVIVQRLAGFGIEARVVSDEALVTNPVRLRAVQFTDDELFLELFGTPGTVRLQREDLALIVSGVLLESRTESIEKRKRRETKTLSQIQTSSDMPVIDLYSKADPTGWRIPATGFDFSCLGPGKSLLVAENMESLTSALLLFSPGAKLVNDYSDLRPMLEHSWPGESRTDALGFQRTGVAGKGLSKIFTTNNSLQFEKYSRLQWHLL